MPAKGQSKYKIGDFINGHELLNKRFKGTGYEYQVACPGCGELKWAQPGNLRRAHRQRQEPGSWRCGPCTYSKNGKANRKYFVGMVIEGHKVLDVRCEGSRYKVQVACPGCGELKWAQVHRLLKLHGKPRPPSSWRCSLCANQTIGEARRKYHIGMIVNGHEVLGVRKRGRQYEAQVACPGCGKLTWVQSYPLKTCKDGAPRPPGSWRCGPCAYAKNGKTCGASRRYFVGDVLSDGRRILEVESGRCRVECTSCGGPQWGFVAQLLNRPTCKYCHDDPGFNYYVYIWRDPYLNQVRYVGKGKNGRAFQHGYQDVGFQVEFATRNVSSGVALRIEAGLIHKHQPDGNGCYPRTPTPIGHWT
jgi:hypothetical protein